MSASLTHIHNYASSETTPCIPVIIESCVIGIGYRSVYLRLYTRIHVDEAISYVHGCACVLSLLLVYELSDAN